MEQTFDDNDDDNNEDDDDDNLGCLVGGVCVQAWNRQLAQICWRGGGHDVHDADGC